MKEFIGKLKHFQTVKWLMNKALLGGKGFELILLLSVQ